MVTRLPGERAAEDLTAKARIRDAALRLFAERGMGGATIRDIATAAGVSGGLVRHHFGSKDDLRAACDSYALEQLMRIKEQAMLAGQAGFLAAAHPTVLLILRYFARSLADGSPSAAAMFDEMVELAETWLAQHLPGEIADLRGFAAILVAMETGLLTAHDQLSRSLGTDVFSPAGHLRMARAKVDFYSHPLLSPETAAQIHATLDQMQAQTEAQTEAQMQAQTEAQTETQTQTRAQQSATTTK
jgi:TetR/AcrR family transcriptional regulator, regulator of cefoperazone and chloramphenicol sensitivity